MNPIRSAHSVSFVRWIELCVDVVAIIQWAVMAMNDVRLVSDQTSVVNEIFPSDF